MGKPCTREQFFCTRTLMLGLAGGVLSFSVNAGEEGYSPESQPPVAESAVSLAVQSALSEMAATGTAGGSLRLSTSIRQAAPNPVAPQFSDATDDGMALRRAVVLADTGVSRLSVDEPPLRISQMIVAPAPGGSPPQWMTLPDAPMPLRASRELFQTMPGAAGVGRPGRGMPLGGAGATELAAEITLPGEQLVAGALTGASAGVAPGTAQPSLLGAFGWSIPPIRWGGSLGYTFQSSSSNSGSSSTGQGLFANMTAASYIYAPWFARVSGRLGITTNSSSSESSVASTNGNSTGSSTVVGGAEVSMFSSTRYPFRAYFDRTDSRTSGTIVGTDYVSNRFGLSQNFRSEDGVSGGNFMVDRNEASRSDGFRDVVTAMSGSYSTPTGIVQNNFSGRYSLGQRSGTGDEARLIGLNSSHTATISDTLNLGGVANFSDSDIRTSSPLGGTTSNRGRYLQLYGYGSWLPDFEDIEDLPLTLSGGIRYSGQESQFGGDAFTAHSLGGNLSALYRYSSNLSLSANGAVNKLTQSKGEGVLLTQLSSSVSYVGTPLSFGNFSYNWNTGGNANWQSAVGSSSANANYGGQASHALSRVYSVQPGQSIAVNASQSIGLVHSQLLGLAQTLNHSVSANFGLTAGERFSGNVNAMLSDVRTSGYQEQAYRVFNLGFFGQGQLSQVSSANINLMFNWADQSYQSVDAFGQPIAQNSQNMSLNGSMAYSHMRFAGVRGLRYNVIFTADTRLRDDRLYGNVNGDVDRARFALTNRLEYRIGLLDFRLSLVNNEVGGKKNALLFFQVSRQFGSY